MSPLCAMLGTALLCWTEFALFIKALFIPQNPAGLASWNGTSSAFMSASCGLSCCHRAFRTAEGGGFFSSSLGLAWQKSDQGDVLTGYTLETWADDTKSGQNAPRSLSLVPLTVWEACRRDKYCFWTQAMSEAGMGEAVLLEEGILSTPPSGKACSIHLAGSPTCQLLLSFVSNIYHIL